MMKNFLTGMLEKSNTYCGSDHKLLGLQFTVELKSSIKIVWKLKISRILISTITRETPWNMES